MPKKPDERFAIACAPTESADVLDLLGGFARRRPLSGEELLRQAEETEARAKSGDPKAQAALARTLLTDEPNFRKNRRALVLLKQAAKKREPEALYLLGLVHLRGQGVARDDALGMRYLEEAAYLGHLAAQIDLAKAYRLGLPEGAERQTAAERARAAEKALYWTRLAAARGDSLSSYIAGCAYRDGTGTPRNYEEAKKWLLAAAKRAVPEAAAALAKLHLRRDYEARDPQEARRWMIEAALAGDAQAQLRVGIFFWSGLGGGVDQREALRWLCRAAENGSGSAASMLAGFFLTGTVLDLDRLRAWVLYRLAERLGDATARTNAESVNALLSPEERRYGRDVLKLESPKRILEALIPRKTR